MIVREWERERGESDWHLPECIRLWMFNELFCVKRFSHNLHSNGFSPVWHRICISRYGLRQNAAGHCTHWNGLPDTLFINSFISIFKRHCDCLFFWSVFIDRGSNSIFWRKRGIFCKRKKERQTKEKEKRGRKREQKKWIIVISCFVGWSEKTGFYLQLNIIFNLNQFLNALEQNLISFLMSIRTHGSFDSFIREALQRMCIESSFVWVSSK